LNEIEDGTFNVVFGASDTFTIKTERIAGKQSIRSQLVNKFYQGNSHLFDKDIGVYRLPYANVHSEPFFNPFRWLKPLKNPSYPLQMA
jgi:hypothetical protein